MRLYVNVLMDTLPKSIQEHDAIIAAIKRGDPRGARRAVETNWRNSARWLTSAISEHGERGSWHLLLPGEF